MLYGVEVRTDNQVIRAVTLPPVLRRMKHIDHKDHFVLEGTKRGEITVVNAEDELNLTKTTSLYSMMKKTQQKSDQTYDVDLLYQLLTETRLQ